MHSFREICMKIIILLSFVDEYYAIFFLNNFNSIDLVNIC